MKTLSLSLALAGALLANSAASAAVVVGAGRVHVAVGRPAGVRHYVAPRPVVRPRPGVLAPAVVHNRREAFWGAVDQRHDAVQEAVQERREAFWGAFGAAVQP